MVSLTVAFLPTAAERAGGVRANPGINEERGAGQRSSFGVIHPRYGY